MKHLQTIGAVIAGLVIAFFLFIAPDTFGGAVSEEQSFAFKIVASLVLVVLGVLLRHKPVKAICAIVAGITLLALAFFGGAIRLSELGVM